METLCKDIGNNIEIIVKAIFFQYKTFIYNHSNL